jgi:hypothetical protein
MKIHTHNHNSPMIRGNVHQSFAMLSPFALRRRSPIVRRRNYTSPAIFEAINNRIRFSLVQTGIAARFTRPGDAPTRTWSKRDFEGGSSRNGKAPTTLIASSEREKQSALLVRSLATLQESFASSGRNRFDRFIHSTYGFSSVGTQVACAMEANHISDTRWGLSRTSRGRASCDYSRACIGKRRPTGADSDGSVF